MTFQTASGKFQPPSTLVRVPANDHTSAANLQPSSKSQLTLQALPSKSGRPVAERGAAGEEEEAKANLRPAEDLQLLGASHQADHQAHGWPLTTRPSPRSQGCDVIQLSSQQIVNKNCLVMLHVEPLFFAHLSLFKFRTVRHEIQYFFLKKKTYCETHSD